ncbi:ABC transporter permease [Fulvivirgaceae bacterium BMA10]|uniref:ABC transporter permease n=1 Tax=Splendidivirga corallicola TaxID=3051826 RepID=A0ABT8KVD0_9BACT|nr:ABC transporter permease [Fulvivirgaceae bacterium BMA10]
MLRNYIKIAYRNLLKNKIFSLINICGLAVGLTCGLFIFLVVRFELSFDGFHDDGSLIYRVNTNSSDGNLDPGSPKGLLNMIKDEFPEVEKVAVVEKLNPDKTQIEVEGILSREKNICFTNREFYEIFNFPLVPGSHLDLMDEPNYVLIEETLADKYFNGNAIGKKITLNNQFELEVAGVLKNLPKNTDLPVSIAVSLATKIVDEESFAPTNLWGFHSFYQTFIKLKAGTAPHVIQSRFEPMVAKYLGEKNIKHRYFKLQALKDIHFEHGNFNDRTASKEVLLSLMLVGGFIIVIACINFINLTTAQAVKRAKEVGIRKAIGGTRAKLMGQFLLEALILIILAAALAYTLASVLVPKLQILTFLSIDQTTLNQPESLLFLLISMFFILVCAGVYPALILSRFKPSEAFTYGLNKRLSGGTMLRKALVIFQFTITQILIIGTIIIMAQLNYFEKRSMGFNKEAILTVDIPHPDLEKLTTIKKELLRNSNISKISYGLNTPSAVINRHWGSYYHTTMEKNASMEIKYVDEDYLSIFGLKLLAGRNISDADDDEDILVNEALLRSIGMEDPHSAIGERIDYWGNSATVVGVIQDFHNLSFHDQIYPIIMVRAITMQQKASFQINMEQAEASIKAIEKQWKKAFPDYFFTYSFLDSDLETYYDKERRFSGLVTFFAGVAIFIAVLGLLGLISFVTLQKAKEIGIRKVFGAGISNILYLLSKDFFWLVMIAFLLSIPVAYWAMNTWLENFIYKIDLQVWMFAAGLSIALMLSWLTIGFKAVRASRMNPVDSLKYE